MGNEANVAFKLDRNKMYDHIDRLYLKEVMINMSFCHKWINNDVCGNCRLLYYCQYVSTWFN